MQRWINHFMLILLGLVTWQGVAQRGVKQLPQDHEQFIKELKTSLIETEQKTLKQLAKDFSKFWEEKADSTVKDVIISNVNKLLAARLRLSPHIRYYLEATLLNFADTSVVSPSFFFEWNKMLESLLAVKKISPKRRKGIDNFLEFIRYFVEDRSLFVAAGHRWRIATTNIKMKTKGDTVIVSVPKTILEGVAINDTFRLYNTEGVFNTWSKKWQCSGGEVRWKQYPREKVRIELPPFEFSMERSRFSVDSAVFINKFYFDEPILGLFQQRLEPLTAPPEKVDTLIYQRKTYPRFYSYDTSYVIKLSAIATYKGPVGMKGNRIVGANLNKKSKSTITITKDGKPFIISRGHEFIFRPEEEVKGDKTFTVIRVSDTDSIYHPGAFLKYMIREGKVMLIRGEEGIRGAPFTSSFHKMEMKPHALTWVVGTDTIYLEMLWGVGKLEAVINSVNYYDEELFTEYAKVTDYHPAARLGRYVMENGYYELTEEEVRDIWNPRLSLRAIRPVLYNMVRDGFIDYDDEAGIIRVREKLIFYTKAAQGRVDYDHLYIPLVDKDRYYGFINLANMELKGQGAKMVILSKRQNAVLYPEGGEVTIHYNRDITLDSARFQLGRFLVFWNKGCYFDYEKFTVDVDEVDSLRLTIPTGEYDIYGREVMVPVKSVIEDLSLIAYIDAPFNKSGRHKLLQYPIIKSKDYSYVYYERPEIQNKAYKRENFYFRLDPFVFDSINAFDPKAIAFDGVFVSANIFPEIRTKLILRPDTSLGIYEQTPEEGYPIYAGKGTYVGTIDMSHHGLWGTNDEVYFSTATLNADSVLFLPEEMRTIAQELAIEPEKGFPQVSGKDIQTVWRPYADTMALTTTSSPFSMYDQQVTMSGTLYMGESYLDGCGELDVFEAYMRSCSFHFRTTDFSADTAYVSFEGTTVDTLALEVSATRVNMDMAHRKGTFMAYGDSLITRFPYNKYVTNLDAFDWFVDAHEMHFYSQEGDSALFLSVNPAQDSLNFKGFKAKFYLDSMLLTVEGIPYIRVADAFVYPYQGIAQIEGGAVMRPLKNSEIRADTIHKYHRFYNATTHIYSRLRFRATGLLDYVDKTGRSQAVKLDSIYVRIFDSLDQNGNVVWKKYVTFADGYIPEEQNFTLNPGIFYRGKVRVYAPLKQLHFNGYARLDLKNQYVITQWFSVNDTLKPDSMYISVVGSRNPAGQYVYAGWHIYLIDYTMYPSVMRAKREPNDHDIFVGKDALTYDPDAGIVTVTHHDRFYKLTKRGPWFQYNDKTGTIEVEGPFEIFRQLGLFEVKAAGYGTHSLDTPAFDMNLTIAIDMPLNKKVVDKLYDFVKANSFEYMDINYNDANVQTGFINLLPEDEVTKFIDETEIQGFYTPSTKVLPHVIVLTNVQLHWDPIRKLFYHMGPVGIVSINGEPVHKMVPAYIQIVKKRSGDYFQAFFDLGYEWLFLRYRTNNLEIAASTNEIRETILSLKKKERKIKDPETKRIFQLLVGSEQVALRYKRTFLELYQSGNQK